MKEHHLDETLNQLKGPSEAHLIVHNQWAATALDEFHSGSNVEFELSIDSKLQRILLKWDSNFSKSTMKEKIDMANHGGVALAWFIMSVILDYKYVAQSEIGDGVDYMFQHDEPNEDDLNFINNSHYVEISGILKESKTNTLDRRIKTKHEQIEKGSKRDENSSVIVTLFSGPKSVKETHK